MSASNHLPPKSVRKESTPLVYGLLTSDQQASFNKVCGLINDLADSEGSSGGGSDWFDSFLPSLRDSRLNQVVLIDGGRGSGKTTVLLTLLRAWSLALRGRTSELAASGYTEKGGVATDRVIVPVGIVDLDPLPEGTNLMLHLAGQLYRVVEAMEDGCSGNDTTAPWQPQGSTELASRKAWRTFAAEVASGWHDRLKHRASGLDNEQYAYEVEQAERQRLNVKEQFTQFVDKLSSDFQNHLKRGSKALPLFVIPIDDADMNPSRCMELLELLRALQHSRVAFLLTGDSNLFLSTLRFQVYGRMREPLRWLNMRGPQLEELGIVAENSDLARSIYDKVIPPQHHAVIPVLALETRMLKLGHLLAKFTIRKSPKSKLARNLIDFFKTSIQSQQALPNNLRAIVDFEAIFNNDHLLDDNDDDSLPAYWKIVNYLWKLSIEQSGNFPGNLLADKFLVKKNIYGRVSRVNDGLRLAIKSTAPLGDVVADGCTVYISRDLVLRGYLGSTELSETTSAVLCLYDNIVSFLRTSAVSISEHYGNDGLFASLVDVQPSREPMGITIRWPVPSVLSLAQRERISKNLMEAVYDDEKKLVDMGLLARMFLHFVLSEFEPRKKHKIDAKNSYEEWGAIVERLHAVANFMTKNADSVAGMKSIASWASSSVLLLAAPESGLLGSDATLFVKHFIATFQSPTPLVIDKLLELRRARFLSAVRQVSTVERERATGISDESTITTMLINDSFGNANYPDHPWHRLMMKSRRSAA